MKVRLIDTPGLEYIRAQDGEDEEKEKARAKDILLRSRGRVDRLKDPLFASKCHRAIPPPGKLILVQVKHIVSRADTQDLMLAYSLPAFSKGDTTSFLAGMARVSGLIKKVCSRGMIQVHTDNCDMQHGILDHAGAARIVLRDWSVGKFARYTMPPGTTPSSADDEKILATLKKRKELRKADDVKLVRLQPGEVERREILLDDVWGANEENSEDEANDEGTGDEETNGDEDGDGDEDGNEDEANPDEAVAEDEEEEDEEDEDEEVPQLLPPPKRKRTVSFAAMPAAGKRQRFSKKRR